mmetsp:Transcript_23925/g.20936  ORF Transcript_23925/g.20936 Transcript_23925/m.20936 type:complete len:296 (-) Transcript_23925:738-1625(-)
MIDDIIGFFKMLLQQFLDVSIEVGIFHIIQNLVVFSDNKHDKFSMNSKLILLSFDEFGHVSRDRQTSMSSNFLPTLSFNDNSHEILVKVALKLSLLKLILFKILCLESLNLLVSSMQQGLIELIFEASNVMLLDFISPFGELLLLKIIVLKSVMDRIKLIKIGLLDAVINKVELVNGILELIKSMNETSNPKSHTRVLSMSKLDKFALIFLSHAIVFSVSFLDFLLEKRKNEMGFLLNGSFNVSSFGQEIKGFKHFNTLFNSTDAFEGLVDNGIVHVVQISHSCLKCIVVIMPFG